MRDNLYEAIEYATKAHKGQIRKTNGLPKIVHPYSVAMLLQKHRYCEEIIIAGLLHDVLEDCKGYTKEDILCKFGDYVMNIVLEVTEPDKKLPWKIRKEEHIKSIRLASYEGKVVCAADKINNAYSLMNDLEVLGEEVWKKFNAPKEEILWYYKEIAKSIPYDYEEAERPIFKELEDITTKLLRRYEHE